MSNRAMDFNLEYGKRKTLTITVRNGQVTVKAPLGMPRVHIDEFVVRKTAWIERKLKDFSAKTDALSTLIDGTHIMYHGAFYEIERTDRYARVRIEDGVFYIPEKYSGEKKESAVVAFLKRSAKSELHEALDIAAGMTGLSYGNFATSNARTQWGSCDGKNNIRLNWRLVMLDRELVMYVAVHELSHTLHHDHSPAFWSTVERYVPEYKAVKKRLKQYSVLTGMYRR